MSALDASWAVLKSEWSDWRDRMKQFAASGTWEQKLRDEEARQREEARFLDSMTGEYQNCPECNESGLDPLTGAPCQAPDCYGVNSDVRLAGMKRPTQSPVASPAEIDAAKDKVTSTTSTEQDPNAVQWDQKEIDAVKRRNDEARGNM